jgi:hypothetical protein
LPKLLEIESSDRFTSALVGIPVVGAVKDATGSFTGLIIMAGATMVRSS